MSGLGWVRDYERINCPGCGRRISAYIPHFGDGSGLRVVKHNISARRRHPWPACEYSERIIVRERGKWILE